MTENEWKDIPGFEGLYQASTHGQIAKIFRGKRRLVQGTIKKREYSDRVVVALFKNGVSKQYQRGRLVAETWLGKIEDGMVVKHRNNDCKDDRLENLAIVPMNQDRIEAENSLCLMGGCDILKRNRCETCGFSRKVHDKRIRDGRLVKGRDGLWRLKVNEN